MTLLSINLVWVHSIIITQHPIVPKEVTKYYYITMIHHQIRALASICFSLFDSTFGHIITIQHPKVPQEVLKLPLKYTILK